MGMARVKPVVASPDVRSMDPAAPRVSGRLTRVAATLAAGTGLALFCGLQLLLEHAPREPSRRTLETRAADLARGFESAAGNALDMLVPLGPDLAAEDPPDWRAFGKMLRAAGAGHTPAMVAWAPVVPERNRAKFEGETGRDAYRSFRMLDRDSDGRFRPAAARGEHLPIALVDPPAEHEKLLGVDLRGDPTLARALERAAETGAPEAVTSSRLLAAGVRGELPVLLVVPVFRGSPARPSKRGTGPHRELAGVLLASVPLPTSSAQATPWSEPVVRLLQLPQQAPARPGRPAPLSVRAPFYVGARLFAIELTVEGPEARLWARARRARK
jgi:CHASE1-domain containing sensor protein